MLIATAGVIHAGDAAGVWKKLQQHRLIPRAQKAEKCYCLLVLCTPPLSSRSRVTSWSGSDRRNTGNNCTYKDGPSTLVRLLYTAQQEFISNQRRLRPHKTVQPQANEIRFVKYINSTPCSEACLQSTPIHWWHCMMDTSPLVVCLVVCWWIRTAQTVSSFPLPSLHLPITVLHVRRQGWVFWLQSQS